MESAPAYQPYLDYLDKEMTIMGILSTFCVAATSLIFDRLASAANGSFFGSLWLQQRHAIILGLVLLLAAALFFFLQRSLLAYFYGSICLTIVRPIAGEFTLTNWLTEVDSWHTWRYYRIAFSAFSLSTLVLAHVIYTAVAPASPRLWWLVDLASAIIVIYALVDGMLRCIYRYAESPYRALHFATLINDWKCRGQQEVP